MKTMSSTQDHDNNVLILANKETDAIYENETTPQLNALNACDYYRNSDESRHKVRRT